MYSGAGTSCQPTLAAQATPILRGSKKRWSTKPSARKASSFFTSSGSLPLSTTVIWNGTSREVAARARMARSVAAGLLKTGMVTLQSGPCGLAPVLGSCMYAPLALLRPAIRCDRQQ